MRRLVFLALMMLGGVAFGEPVVLQLDFSAAGTNRADGTFFGFDFDRPVADYPHRGDDFWCKTGTVCKRTEQGENYKDYDLVSAELKKPFHGFTNLTVKCAYDGGRKVAVLEFLREAPGVAAYEENEKWMRELQDDIQRHCDVGRLDNSSWDKKLNMIRLFSTHDGRSGLAVEMAVCGIGGMKKGANGPAISKPCTTYWLKVYRVKDAQGK